MGSYAIHAGRVYKLDEEGAPYAFVVARNDGYGPPHSYYFKMSPDPKDKYNRDSGMGYAYEVQVGEQDKLIWKTAGWYSFQVFLANNGLDLVRIGNWPQGRGPKAEDLAVAFLHEGRVVKQYSTADLIKDVSAIHPSVSHYHFLGEGHLGFADPEYEIDRDKEFELTTADGLHYRFTVGDGSIRSVKKE